MRLSDEKSYTKKVDAQFFPEEGKRSGIDGELFSGRKQGLGRVEFKGIDGTGNRVYEQIHDDIQFQTPVLDFDPQGTTEQIVADDAFGVNNGSNVTISFWCKMGILTGTTTTNKSIFGIHQDSWSVRGLQISLTKNSDGGIRFRAAKPTGGGSAVLGVNIINESDYSSDEWIYLVCQYSGSGIRGRAWTSALGWTAWTAYTQVPDNVRTGANRLFIRNSNSTNIPTLKIFDFCYRSGGTYTDQELEDQRTGTSYVSAVRRLVSDGLDNQSDLYFQRTTSSPQRLRWTTDTANHYNFIELPADYRSPNMFNKYGYNEYTRYTGFNFIQLATGFELANDFKVVLEDVVIDPQGTAAETLFTANGGYYFWVNVRADRVVSIGIQTSTGFIETTLSTFGIPSLNDGKAHNIEVIKSSTGDGSGNGLKVIVDEVDYGWDSSIADTTLDLISQSTISGISCYFNTSSQRFTGYLGTVTYKDINDVVIKTWNLANGFDSPVSIDSPTQAYVPASLTTPTKDVVNKDLEYKGKLALRAQIVDSAALKLNGVDQNISFGTIKTNSPQADEFELEFYLRSVGGSNQYFWSLYAQDGANSGDHYGIGINTSGHLRILRNDGGQEVYENSNIVFEANTYYKVKYEFTDNINAAITINGVRTVLNFTQVKNYAGQSNFTMYVGGFRAGFSSNTDVWNYNYVENGSVLVKAPICEGNGITIYDVSGNNNHGEVINASLPSNWTTQPVFAWNFYEGFQRSVSINGLNSEDIYLGDNFNETLKGVSESTYVLIASGYFVFSYSISNGDRLGISRNTSGEIIAQFNSEGTTASRHIRTYTGFTEDKVYKIVFRFDGAESTDETKLRIWIDDVEESYSDNGQSMPSITPNSGNLKLSLNSILFNATEYYSDGNSVYSYFAVYSTALSVSECSNYSFKETAYLRYDFTEGEGGIVNSGTFSNGESAIRNNTSPWITDPRQSTPFSIKGYKHTGKWNGASKIQFPDLPSVNKLLKGNSLTKDQIDSLGTMGVDVMTNNKSFSLLNEGLTNIELRRSLNLENLEPETIGYRDYIPAGATVSQQLPEQNLFELDLLVKAIKKAHNLVWGTQNLDTIFEYLFVHALELDTETYQDTGLIYTDIPRHWAKDISGASKEIRENTGSPILHFTNNKGLSSDGGANRMTINNVSLSSLSNSTVVGRDNMEMGGMVVDNLSGTTALDYLATGFDNSSSTGLYVGVDWDSNISARFFARLNSSTLSYSNYHNMRQKMFSVKRVGTDYEFYLDGELDKTVTGVTTGNIPTEQFFAYMSSAWSGGGLANVSCVNKVAVNYMGSANDIDTKALHMILSSYLKRRDDLIFYLIS